ncbi:hypothetical protein [Burkholderia arboris]|uniref:hypothetical protein n=1 Tax=Burkholderia arboris TaxID=488730 RepID=UPI0030F2670F
MTELVQLENFPCQGALLTPDRMLIQDRHHVLRPSRSVGSARPIGHTVSMIGKRLRMSLGPTDNLDSSVGEIALASASKTIRIEVKRSIWRLAAK